MIVYKHTCIITGKCYIGLTVKTMMARWAEHIADANRNKRRKFFAALNKYEPENWIHEVLFESEYAELIIEKEIEYTKLYNSVKNGYNTIYGGTRSGIKHREDSIEVMRISQKAAHARRRDDGTEGGWTRKDGGPMLGKEHPNKGGTNVSKGKSMEQIRKDVELKRLNKQKGIV